MIMNIEKISPLKRELVRRISQKASENEYVERLMIFGSSIRDNCRKDSDIDICISWTEDPYDSEKIYKPFVSSYKPFVSELRHYISAITEGNADVVNLNHIYRYEPFIKKAVEQAVLVYHK